MLPTHPQRGPSIVSPTLNVSVRKIAAKPASVSHCAMSSDEYESLSQTYGVVPMMMWLTRSNTLNSDHFGRPAVLPARTLGRVEELARVRPRSSDLALNAGHSADFVHSRIQGSTEVHRTRRRVSVSQSLPWQSLSYGRSSMPEWCEILVKDRTYVSQT